MFCAAGLILSSFLAACGGGGDQGRDPILGLPAAELVSVSVTPATATVLMNGTQQYTATASYSDGSSTNVTSKAAWTSASPTIATVGAATGLASGISAGTAALSASFGSKSGSANLVVTAPVPPPAPTLTAITVTPAGATIVAGTTQQYIATGTYSNLSTAVLTGVTWSSASPAFASIAASGMATGLSAGTTQISATLGTIVGSAPLIVTAPVVPAATLLSIAITPLNASIAVGASQQYTVTGSYSNATSAVISTGITWSSSAQSVATIQPTGLATGVSAGTSNIGAAVGALNASTVLTVTAAPAVSGINLGGAARFAVLAGTSITNNAGGTTLVTGDVGAPSQTTDPVQAAGFTNFKSGAILAQGLADLQLAVTDANSRPCTVTSAAGIDLGGLVLTPGVYCYAGAISITGTFTMNGPGLYIFRTTSTLNSTANSIVALNGGATAANVFWVPVGPTTLGANSVFKGTILGASAAITLGDNTSLQDGRVLTQAAVTLNNNKITKP